MIKDITDIKVAVRDWNENDHMARRLMYDDRDNSVWVDVSPSLNEWQEYRDYAYISCMFSSDVSREGDEFVMTEELIADIINREGAISYNAMDKALKEIGKKYSLDFTSATCGNCCGGCMDFDDIEVARSWEHAETYLVAMWYEGGMNYTGGYLEQRALYLKWNFDIDILQNVCRDLKELLGVEVEVPRDKSMTIKVLAKHTRR